MEHRHLVPKDREFYRIRVRCRAAAQDPQNPPDDQQRDHMNHHTTEPAAPASAQAKAITLKWHPSRNQIERAFHRLKQFRAVATKYDKLKERYHATVIIASIMIWLRPKPDRAGP